jgi:hypothetical protein
VNDLDSKDPRGKRQDTGELTEDELEAVYYYTSSGARLLNRALRGGGSLSPRLSKLLEGLDGAMQKETLPRMTVWRGVDRSFFDTLKVGRTFLDKGFVSCETDRSYSAQGDSLQINIPGGHAGLHAGGAEYEVILPRDSLFRVVDIRDEASPKGKMQRVAELNLL